jgi:fructose-1,6-bisphosphatase/sedoheptulose 1,7-bisphosphatase-like protein
MTTTPAAPGRRTGVQVIIPPDRLASHRIYSRAARRFSADELRSWNERNAPLLSQYGLEIADVSVLPIEPPLPARGPRGALQMELLDRLLLTATLGALAVSLSGRGDLLAVPPPERDKVKRSFKETNDRNSTAAMAESLYALSDASPGVSLQIAIGEGARKKPGERGGNPTLYSGQVIRGAGAGTAGKSYHLAVDTVEGTTKSTLFDPSCGTLLFITEAPIAAVPDMYFDKCQLRGVDGVTVADSIERIVEAVMEARGTREVNFFTLDRPRHPIDRMVRLGACMRVDSDGDAYPAIAAGLAWGVYPDNLRPLDGVCGNIGGAAETIASAAGASYMGVRSTARFVTGKVKRWEERYNLDDAELADIRGRGLVPERVHRVDDLVPGLAQADGAFVAAAISDNWHIPGLQAAYVGSNFASVNGLFVGAAGTADIYTITFSYRQPYEATLEKITPVLTRLLRLPVGEIPTRVAAAVADAAQARRLRHEIATSYYTHITDQRGEGAGGQRLRLDFDSAARVESPESAAVLQAARRSAPDWFA